MKYPIISQLGILASTYSPQDPKTTVFIYSSSVTYIFLYPRLHAQNIKLQQLIKDNQKLENDITEVKATCEKIKSLLEVVLGMKDNQEDSIDYKINDDDVPV